ncbi:MAG: LPD23 domain-containing protein, partial [Gammaproteobacteria bacterium]
MAAGIERGLANLERKVTQLIGPLEKEDQAAAEFYQRHVPAIVVAIRQRIASQARAKQEEPAAPDDGRRYSYLGEQAARADKSALTEAIELSRLGMPRERIRERTGWFKGRDERWRFEISDRDSSLMEGWRNAKTVGEAFDHPKLYENYPALADIDLSFADLGQRNGEFHPDSGRIVVSNRLSAERVRSVLLHELQHAVQRIERFARGGSPNTKAVQALALERYQQQFRRLKASLDGHRGMQDAWVGAVLAEGTYSDREAADQAYRKAFPEYAQEARKLMKQIEVLDLDSLAYQTYKRLLGEVEARDVEERADYSDGARSLLEPYISQGISEEDFILQFGEEGSALDEGPPVEGRPRGAPLPGNQKPGPAGLLVSELRETLAARFGAGVGRLIESKTLRI